MDGTQIQADTCTLESGGKVRAAYRMGILVLVGVGVQPQLVAMPTRRECRVHLAHVVGERDPLAVGHAGGTRARSVAVLVSGGLAVRGERGHGLEFRHGSPLNVAGAVDVRHLLEQPRLEARRHPREGRQHDRLKFGFGYDAHSVARRPAAILLERAVKIDVVPAGIAVHLAQQRLQPLRHLHSIGILILICSVFVHLLAQSREVLIGRLDHHVLIDVLEILRARPRFVLVRRLLGARNEARMPLLLARHFGRDVSVRPSLEVWININNNVVAVLR